MIPLQGVSVFLVLISVLVLQRLAELALAERNRRWALARGGVEYGGKCYSLMVVVHTLFYASIILEWHYRSQGWSTWWPFWVAVLALAQLLRIWAIKSLGCFWNTRVIVLPAMQPVANGPYRYIRHPNYLAVIIEIFTIPALCGAYVTAAAFSLANAMILARRIPEEERALKDSASSLPSPLPRFLPRRNVQ